MSAQHLGRAYAVRVIGDEDGFELHISAEHGDCVVNVHSISEQLLAAVTHEIGGWLQEGRQAAAEHQRDLDRADGYDRSDPKHPDWHSVHADLYDNRSEK